MTLLVFTVLLLLILLLCILYISKFNLEENDNSPVDFKTELKRLKPAALNISENTRLLEIIPNVNYYNRSTNTIKILRVYNDNLPPEAFLHEHDSRTIGEEHTLIVSPSQEFMCITDEKLSYLSGQINVVRLLTHTNLNIHFIEIQAVSLHSTRTIIQYLNFIITIIRNFQKTLQISPANLICLTTDNVRSFDELRKHLIFLSPYYKLESFENVILIAQTNMIMEIKDSKFTIPNVNYDAIPIENLLDARYSDISHVTTINSSFPRKQSIWSRLKQITTLGR
ncbi:MAG: hypothetical protein ACRYGG_02300 [Janthinobacterium lividum]